MIQAKLNLWQKKLHALKGIDVDEFCEIAFNNGKRVFGIE